MRVVVRMPVMPAQGRPQVLGQGPPQHDQQPAVPVADAEEVLEEEVLQAQEAEEAGEAEAQEVEEDEGLEKQGAWKEVHLEVALATRVGCFPTTAVCRGTGTSAGAGRSTRLGGAGGPTAGKANGSKAKLPRARKALDSKKRRHDFSSGFLGILM